MAASSSDQTHPETSPGAFGAGPAPDHVGEQIGRFTILRRIGKGGMGVVYVAYDSELDRRVAVKLLRSELSALPGIREQLLYEAQMLAKLSHPNVLHVYDVGIHRHQIYLALEYVEGETLRAWQARHHGDWRVLVAMYRACGEGLAAAHSAGVVHRDFKPENVLVGVDGRPRVLDFGLATLASGAPGSHGADMSSSSYDRGRQVGTPAYMSPEQHAGQEADARSDQFNFCASLYEALYGVRAFKGTSLQELGESVLRGARVPRRRGTPAWLRRVVLRGLSLDPGARWPSMQTLLEELDRRAQGPAALWTMYMAAVALAAGALFVSRDTEPICRGAAGRLLGVWDVERRAAAEQAVLAIDVPFAATTWARVANAIDVQAEGWIERRNDVCAATYVRAEQSFAALERRNACLDDRLLELDAFVQVLMEARPETIASAVGAAARLRPLSLCDDDALLASVSRPDGPASASEGVRRQLARVEGLRRSGDLTAAIREAEAAQRAASLLADRPLQAEAALALGRTALGLSRFPEAAEQLEAAFHGARRLRHDDVTLAAALELIAAQCGLSRYDAAELWARFAEDDLLRAGDPKEPRVTWLLSRAQLALDRGEPAAALAWAQEALSLQGSAQQAHPDTPRIYELLGQTYSTLDRLDEALAAYDQGLAQAVEIFGEQHPGVVPLLHGRASVLAARGQFDEALTVTRRGLEINAAVFGAAHPRYATSLAQIGSLIGRQGRYDAALEHLNQALAIRTRALGPNHRTVGETLIAIGKFERHRGAVASAVRATERAIFVLSRALGPDHITVAMAKMNLGVLLSAKGHHERGLVMLIDVQQQLERILPPTHGSVLSARGNRVHILRLLERYDEAITELQQQVIVAETPGVKRSWLMGTLVDLGTTQLERGTPAEAVGPLERALALAVEDSRDAQQRDTTRAIVRAATGSDPGHLREQIELTLATALWNSRLDRPRARRIAAMVVASLRAAGPDAAAQLREAELWLRRRSGR